MNLKDFEELWVSLKNNQESGWFEYDDLSVSIREVVNSHFRKVIGIEKYGVYVIRQKDSDDVLYIGMSGTIDQSGNFKGQDIPKRLKNVKGGDVSANEWFKSVVEQNGAIRIEYVFLGKTPMSPALVEAELLQSILNSNGCLPSLNKRL